MLMLLKTAFRSLLNHKSKTILLMVVLIIGSFLTMIGLSGSFTFSENLRVGLTETMSGDIVVYNFLEKSKIDIIMPIQRIKPIEDYKKAIEIMQNNPAVKTVTPLSKDIGISKNPETDEIDSGLPIIGAKIDKYFEIFKKNEVVEGEMIPTPLPEKVKVIPYKIALNQFNDKYLFAAPTKADQELVRNSYRMSIDMENYILKEDVTQEDREKLYEIFDKMNVLEVKEDVGGLLISKKFLDLIPDQRQKRFKIGNVIDIQSFSGQSSIRIKEVKIYGLIDIDGSDFSVVNNIIDFNTFQKLVGYDLESKKLDDEQKKSFLTAWSDEEDDGLFADDEDSLFADDEDEEELNLDEAPDYLGSEQTDFIIARVKDPSLIDETVAKLNEEFALLRVPKEISVTEFESDLITSIPKDEKELLNNNYEIDEEKDKMILKSDLERETMLQIASIFDSMDFSGAEYYFKAISYQNSSGNIGAFVALIGMVISIVILIVQVISIIIITNSILMGVIQRTNEIGTMRAIGAHKNYIFRLIITENSILSFVSSLIGTSLAALFIVILGNLGIKANNAIEGMIYGGRVLYPQTNIVLGIISVLIVVFVTFLATLYPVKIATKVSPLEAMNKA